jgi:hypothetical protein
MERKFKIIILKQKQVISYSCSAIINMFFPSSGVNKMKQQAGTRRADITTVSTERMCVGKQGGQNAPPIKRK